LPNYMTPEGKTTLKILVERLADTVKSLKLEKSEDPLLRQRLRQAERDFLYYEHRLKTAIQVDNSGCATEEVRFGALVTIREEAGTQREYVIVGEDEADAAAGRISWASPLASVLLGASSGDHLTWRRDTGETRLEIISVDYPKKADAPKTST